MEHRTRRGVRRIRALGYVFQSKAAGRGHWRQPASWLGMSALVAFLAACGVVDPEKPFADPTDDSSAEKAAENANGTRAELQDVDFELEPNSDVQVEAESVVVAAAGERVTAPSMLGRFTVTRGTPDTTECGDCRQVGDVVRLPSRTPRDLAPGAYVEQIRFKVTDPRLDFPVEKLKLRFFEVSEGGQRPMTREEYDRAVTPEIRSIDAKGRLVQAVQGVGFKRPSALPSSKQRTAAVLQEISDTGDVGDRSEVNEK